MYLYINIKIYSTVQEGRGGGGSQFTSNLAGGSPDPFPNTDADKQPPAMVATCHWVTPRSIVNGNSWIEMVVHKKVT